MITIGVMSGTSLDGADAVAVDFRDDGTIACLGSAGVPMPPELGAELLALAVGTDNEIERMGDASVALAKLYARAVDELLAAAGLRRADVAALGVHGQTVRHRPERGFTLQLNHPALVAELTGIDVVADLRSRDVAAGGEGAPLVPAFHAAVFSGDRPTAVLNVGGIANFTLLPAADDAAGTVLGFDCGPGNMLLDHWMRTARGLPYDAEGAFARSGAVDEALLEAMLAGPYFARPIPKSTGRELFSPAWLAAHLGGVSRDPRDVAATLTELTARSAAEALMRWAPETETLLICGGGALNPFLRERLAAALRALGSRIGRVDDTSARGLDPMAVEGAAFAWLAHAFLTRRPGNLPAVTRAAGPRILGALYPAG